MVIDQVTLYADNTQIVQKLASPISISGVGRFIVPLNDQLKVEWNSKWNWKRKWWIN